MTVKRCVKEALNEDRIYPDEIYAVGGHECHLFQGVHQIEIIYVSYVMSNKLTFACRR